MGVKVHYANLSHEIQNSNDRLREYAETAENCIQALDAYCDETELTGSAYTNSKKFFSETYKFIIEQVKEICDNMVENNNKLLSTFRRIVPTTYGFAADTGVIEEEIRRLQNENLHYQLLIDSYTGSLSYQPFTVHYHNAGKIATYHECIRCNKILIESYEEVVDNLYYFDECSSSIFDDSISRVAELTVALLDLGKPFPEGTTGFTIPDSLLKLLEKLEKAEKKKLMNKDGSLNYDKLLKLIEKCDDMTVVELRVVWSIMYPLGEKCPTGNTFKNLRDVIIDDLTTADFDNTESYQKDILIILYENKYEKYAESMNKFLNSISDNPDYSDDIRNIKYISYTAYDPYRSIFLTYAGDIEVKSWNTQGGQKNECGNGIYVNINSTYWPSGKIKDRNGANDSRGPYATLYEECFHAIDDLLGVDSPCCNGLYKAARDDVSERVLAEIKSVDSNGKCSDRYQAILNNIIGPAQECHLNTKKEKNIYNDVIENITEELNGHNQNYIGSTVSDVFGGYTNNSIVANWGHFDDVHYWYTEEGKITDHQQSELFADWGSLNMTRNDEAIDVTKHYFPEATEKMEKEMDDHYEKIVNGGN